MYCVLNKVLFHRELGGTHWRMVVPQVLTVPTVAHVHCKLGHAEIFKTIQYLKRSYFWKDMSSHTKQYIKSSDLCQRIKALNFAMEGLYEHVGAKEPSELVTVDFYGPLPRGRAGIQYLFVLLDAFSKYVYLYPVKRATTSICLKRIFQDYIPRCGKPRKILSDHGTQFNFLSWRAALEKANIQVRFSLIRHPQSNTTERVMRKYGKFFRAYCSDQHTKWIQYVPRIESLLNLTTQHSTGFPPEQVHFGRNVDDEIRSLFNFPKLIGIPHVAAMDKAHARIRLCFESQQRRQKTISSVKLDQGDLVLVRVSHFV